MVSCFEVKAALVTEEKSNDERDLLSKYTRSFQNTAISTVRTKRGYCQKRLLVFEVTDRIYN